MTNLDLLFLYNDKKLKKSFNYDLITTQIHFIARRSKDFSIPPSKHNISLANILLNHLLKYSGDEESLKETLLGIQAKELINDYIQSSFQ